MKKLSAVFPDDIPDVEALAAEIEIFMSHCNKKKAERKNLLEQYTIRDAAVLASNAFASTTYSQMLPRCIVYFLPLLHPCAKVSDLLAV